MPHTRSLKLVAISGSLRAESVNSALLRVAAALAPSSIRVEVFEGLEELPLFNTDLERALPASVARLRYAVANADGMIIASPEYAHGVSSVIKTALDWLVSLESFHAKPVAVLNAQPRAQLADSALRETLRTMSASVIEPASVAITLSADTLSARGMMASERVCGEIRTALRAFEESLRGPGALANPSFPLHS